jgi:hypothetical protein
MLAQDCLAPAEAARRARIVGVPDLSALRPMSAAARRHQRNGDENFDVELTDLPLPPPGVNGCCASKPLGSPPLALFQVRCSSASSAKLPVDPLIADLIYELHGRPYDLTLVVGGMRFEPKPTLPRRSAPPIPASETTTWPSSPRPTPLSSRRLLICSQ